MAKKKNGSSDVAKPTPIDRTLADWCKLAAALIDDCAPEDREKFARFNLAHGILWAISESETSERIGALLLERSYESKLDALLEAARECACPEIDVPDFAVLYESLLAIPSARAGVA